MNVYSPIVHKFNNTVHCLAPQFIAGMYYLYIVDSGSGTMITPTQNLP